MKIFKENSYDIVRLYVNQLGIMIFSMLLYTAVGENTTLGLLVSLFSTVFYLVLIYYVVWEIGAKDKIRIEGGKAEPCKYKGLVMGLFANVPNFVLGLLTTVFVSVAMLSGGSGITSTFAIFNLITRIHASMYMGFITAVVPTGLSTGSIDFVEYLIETILFTLIPLVSVGITHLAYHLGSKEKKIFSFLSSKK